MERLRRIETFARIGYLARAVVYVLLGYFALTTAGGQGTSDVLQQIKDAPAGTVLLYLVGIGLAGYGVFRLYGAYMDLQGHGSDSKGLAVRIGHAGSGLAHLVLAYVAFRAAGGSAAGGGGGQQTGEAASTVAQIPGGEALILIIGVGFFFAAINQGVKAYTGRFMGLLDAAAPSFAEIAGRLGYAARAVVFAVLGWQVTSAVLSSTESQIGGIGRVLNSLRDTGWLYTVVAIGLILFGIFSLVMARYRRIRNDDVVARLKAA